MDRLVTTAPSSEMNPIEKSSEVILEAERMAFERWGPNRLYTYVDPKKISSPNPGYCFKMAGWKFAGISKSGKHLLVKETI